MTAHVDGSRLHRTCSPTTCLRCHAVVYRGLDGRACALEAIVDPRPLTPTGEVEALRDGRRTYWLLDRELAPRDRWSIPGHPPGPDRTVLAEHRCHDPLPAHWLAPPPPATPARPVEEF